eukprot:Clim_evm8s32 gene=Clim_evmTU8s32
MAAEKTPYPLASVPDFYPPPPLPQNPAGRSHSLPGHPPSYNASGSSSPGYPPSPSAVLNYQSHTPPAQYQPGGYSPPHHPPAYPPSAGYGAGPSSPGYPPQHHHVAPYPPQHGQPQRHSIAGTTVPAGQLQQYGLNNVVFAGKNFTLRAAPPKPKPPVEKPPAKGLMGFIKSAKKAIQDALPKAQAAELYPTPEGWIFNGVIVPAQHLQFKYPKNDQKRRQCTFLNYQSQYDLGEAVGFYPCPKGHCKARGPHKKIISTSFKAKAGLSCLAPPVEMPAQQCSRCGHVLILKPDHIQIRGLQKPGKRRRGNSGGWNDSGSVCSGGSGGS